MNVSFRKRVTARYRSSLRLRIDNKNKTHLKNHDFSIISANCIGGIIYHDLGLQFTSPTINLFFKAPDYIKFLSKLKFYLDVELIEDQSNTLKYPVGILGDIKIYFVHYKDFNEAKAKWIKRTKRLNLQKLYVLMIERDECTYKEIKEFDELPYEKKVIFVRRNMPEIKSSIYLNCADNGNVVIDITQYISKLTGKRYLDQFDYVSWLNDDIKNKMQDFVKK